MTHNFKDDQIDRIIEMAWEDRTPFDAIELQFGLKENDVRKIMRTSLKESSFKIEIAFANSQYPCTDECQSKQPKKTGCNDLGDYIS